MSTLEQRRALLATLSAQQLRRELYFRNEEHNHAEEREIHALGRLQEVLDEYARRELPDPMMEPIQP